MNERVIDKFDLKKWGVPFEVEQRIHEEMVSIAEKSLNCGVWCAVSEFANIREAKQLIPEVIKSTGYTYEECLDLMEECKFNNDILRPIVEKMFNVYKNNELLKYE